MAARQTAAALAMSKRLDKKKRIRDVWDHRLQIHYSGAKKVTPAMLEISFVGLEWEAEFTVKGSGTQVILITAKSSNLKENRNCFC